MIELDSLVVTFGRGTVLETHALRGVGWESTFTAADKRPVADLRAAR